VEPIKFLHLSEEDIINLDISMAQVIRLVEKGLAEHGKGKVENPPKPGIHPVGGNFIHAMPAYYQDLNIGGIKWVSGFPGNRTRGLPQIIGLVVLNDMGTGQPTCVMDGTWITAMRTPAVSAVTAKYCARADSAVLGIVGAGVQGRLHPVAIKEVLPGLETVQVFDLNPQASQKFKEETEAQTGLKVVICPDVESLAKSSDIIVTATQRLERPLIKNQWFPKGALGMGLEASRAWCGDTILAADKFVTDDWNQTSSYKAAGAFPDGLPSSYAELGTIITGKNKGRENDEERILAINIGLALEDIILADYIYRTAKKRGGYTELSL